MMKKASAWCLALLMGTAGAVRAEIPDVIFKLPVKITGDVTSLNTGLWARCFVDMVRDERYVTTAEIKVITKPGEIPAEGVRNFEFALSLPSDFQTTPQRDNRLYFMCRVYQSEAGTLSGQSHYLQNGSTRYKPAAPGTCATVQGFLTLPDLKLVADPFIYECV